MISKFKALSIAAILAGAVFGSLPALADTIQLTFDNPNQSGKPGSVLSFSGSVFAPVTNVGTVNLNFDSATGYSFDSPAASAGGSGFDDSNGFLANFVSVDPGQTIKGLLFTITLPSNIAPGSYISSYEILGGPDTDSSNVTTTRQFQITVPGAAVTPEPSTWLLLITGVGAVAVCLLFRKEQSSMRL